MTTPKAADYVRLLLTQEGNKYLWGSKPNPSINDPKPMFIPEPVGIDRSMGIPEDCSGLVSWGANHLKVQPPMPDGSINQSEHSACRNLQGGGSGRCEEECDLWPAFGLYGAPCGRNG